MLYSYRTRFHLSVSASLQFFRGRRLLYYYYYLIR
nr:MAG TPA: hypothetical protein [Caudoviricetes sp.]